MEKAERQKERQIKVNTTPSPAASISKVHNYLHAVILLSTIPRPQLHSLAIKDAIHVVLMYLGCLQLFPERLSEKVHPTIPKGIVGGF